MRRKGYQLTRYADDWVVTCASAAEARAALEAASRVLKELGVTINPAEDADCACSARLRISRIQDQARTQAYEPADKQDQDEYPTGIALCLSPREIDQPLQAADSSAHTATRTREYSGADTAGQSRRAGLGPPLQAGPRPKALPPARRMAGAAKSGRIGTVSGAAAVGKRCHAVSSTVSTG